MMPEVGNNAEANEGKVDVKSEPMETNENETTANGKTDDESHGKSDDVKDDKKEEEPPKVNWLPATEILPTEEQISAEAPDEKHISNQSIRTHKVLCLRKSYVLEQLKKEPDVNEEILKAEKSHSDLVTAVYEGGFQIWDCTYDLAKLLVTSIAPNIKGKNILDLGCGSGLLGLMCLKMEAKSVTFQDYNVEVLKHMTIPNVVLNDKESLSRCKFWSGDWESFTEQNLQNKYDVILSSETIYNRQNYSKLFDVVTKLMTPHGVAYFAAKGYYFGVGGTIKSFIDAMEKTKELQCVPVFRTTEGVIREVLEVSRASVWAEYY